MVHFPNALYRGVRIVGAGAYVPTRVVDNRRIAEAIPGWSPERIEEKTSIRERRWLWEVDAEAGVAVAPPLTAGEPASNTDMCEVALRKALEVAGLPAAELDAVFLVTCTPDRLNFNHDAMEVHRRLGCRPDAYALVIDDGCGGTPYMLDMAYRMIRSGALRTVAVIGSTLTSPQLDREVHTGWVDPGGGRNPVSAFLSMYLFGDGAGAVVVRGDGMAGEGIVASTSGNDYAELVLRRAGGAMRPVHRGLPNPAENTFVVDGQLVAESYGVFMQKTIDALLAERPELAGEVKRYYFHQPNKRLMDRFVASAGLDPARVAYNVDRYGNTSAAGMFILLAEDLEAGTVRLGSGDLVMIAAVGANVHYGGQLVRL
ncbi:MAG TPA: ketoacyl-ACP synthase III [Longimicrobium sp.]|jgi:3-oxoacyl-[acyl-carrier-protein] synthase III